MVSNVKTQTLYVLLPPLLIREDSHYSPHHKRSLDRKMENTGCFKCILSVLLFFRWGNISSWLSDLDRCWENTNWSSDCRRKDQDKWMNCALSKKIYMIRAALYACYARQNGPTSVRRKLNVNLLLRLRGLEEEQPGEGDGKKRQEANRKTLQRRREK